MTDLQSSGIFRELRRVLPKSFHPFLDKAEDHPVAAQWAADLARDRTADRAKLRAKLDAVPAAYEKRLAAAEKAAVKAQAHAVAAEAAYRQAKAEARDAAMAWDGVMRSREAETARREGELRANAPQVLPDAIAAVRSLCMNAHLPDLDGGTLLSVGWEGRGVTFVEVPGLADWHIAARVQREVIEALEALQLQAISEADAAEAVTVQLRKLAEATVKVKAPGFELTQDLRVLQVNPLTLERKVLEFRETLKETAQ